MIDKLVKAFFALVDYILAGQIASKMGFGHQADRISKLDKNSLFMADVVSCFQGPLKVIELSSGRGTLARKILSKANIDEYVACDIDPSGLKVLEKRIKKAKYKDKVNVHIMDCLNPDINKENYFDIVIAEKLLHLLSPEDIEKVFEYANKILKPGGLFFISSASTTNFVFERTVSDDKHELYRKLKNDLITKLWYNIYKPYVFFINREYITEICQKTGFVIRNDLIYPLEQDYLTLAVCKMSPINQ